MQRIAPLFLSLLFFAGIGFGCSLEHAVCAKQAECAADPPGEEFEKICRISYAGHLDALRANTEQECLDLADALEALDSCRVELDCDAFNQGAASDACQAEEQTYADAVAAAAGECGSLD